MSHQSFPTTGSKIDIIPKAMQDRSPRSPDFGLKTNMRKLAPIFFFLSLCAAPAAAENCSPLTKLGSFLAYKLEPRLSGSVPEMQVDVSFRLVGVQAIDLHLPSEWRGQQHLYRAIQSIETLSPETVLRETADPARRHLTFPRGQIVRLRYRITQDWEGEPSPETYFRAILRPTFFQFTGHNFLVHPALSAEQRLPTSVEWNLPANWRGASSLTGDATCPARAPSLLKVMNGLFLGGDFRLLQVPLKGNLVQVAIRGTWDFSDQAFSQLASSILGTERAFWHDAGGPHYLISLLPSKGPPGTSGGFALEDCFAAFMSDQKAELKYDMKFLLAHEVFHSWNAGRLGDIPPEGPPFWFVEGFSDYYARVLLLRGGLIDAEEYIRDLNGTYNHYRTSDVVAAGGQDVREGFFTSDKLRKLAYQRGSLLAATWDAQIRRRSQGKQSLDDAMRALHRKASTSEQMLTDSALGKHFAAFVGDEAVRDVDRFIAKGQIIPLPLSGLEPCVTQQTVTAYAYEPGFDVDAMERTRIVSGVKPGSEADRAGLRDGQGVLEASAIPADDPNQTISITVADGPSSKVVRYFPRGFTAQISEYALDPLGGGPTGQKECQGRPTP